MCALLSAALVRFQWALLHSRQLDLSEQEYTQVHFLTSVMAAFHLDETVPGL